MQSSIRCKWLVVAVMFAVSGCAANKSISIKSTPSGATVFVDGKQVGVTPLVLTTDDLMPRRAFDGRPSTQAMLVIEKPGHAAYQVLLREFALPDQVNAELQVQAQNAATSDPALADLMKEIGQLQELRDKGAITDEEFEKLKKRAMDRATAKPPD